MKEDFKYELYRRNDWLYRWRKSGHLWIYAIEMHLSNSENLPIKIGIANSIETRTKTLQSASPFALKLFTYFPAVEAGKTEREIHSYFIELRLKGEWFKPSDDLKKFLLDVHSEFANAVEYSRPDEIKLLSRARIEKERIETFRQYLNQV